MWVRSEESSNVEWDMSHMPGQTGLWVHILLA